MDDDKETIKKLRREIRIMQESLERKNKDLDAMHFVWCDGGCPSGVHRHSDDRLTEEIVCLAEINVKRLRTWFDNKSYRDKNAQEKADG